MRDSVREIAAALLELGVQKGDRIALIAEGCASWIAFELAILYTGAINVPISIKLGEPEELRFRLTHSGCKIAALSVSQMAKIRVAADRIPALEKILLIGSVTESSADVITEEELRIRGRDCLMSYPGRLEQVSDAVGENDPANICYTSGTTTDPKGVVLTHKNYWANVEQASALLPIPCWHCSLLVLPWDHAFAHTAGIYTMIRNGASIAAVQIGKSNRETLKNIPINIREVRPTFLLSVPALAQNFRKTIERQVRNRGSFVEWLFHLGLGNAYLYNGEGWNRGRGWRCLRAPLVWLFDRLLFKKVRAGFGGRLQFFIGGGALLDIELQRFFYAIGIPIYQGYGLTEAAPIISANVPEKHKLGSSGLVMPGLELKISGAGGRGLPVGETGEIAVKGDNVMAGYWMNASATREILRDGWLHTGDLGYLDKDGFLHVLGREKSLLISDDGEKYSPEGIEEAILSACPLIDQVMLYNNQSPATIALVVPSRSELRRLLDLKGLPFSGEVSQFAALQALADSLEQFRKEHKRFPSKWLPRTFAVIDEGFSEQNQLLNSTLKMVRGQISERYRDRLELLLTTQGRRLESAENIQAISRVLRK
jgi:long-chain acyl-CoA synthetase